jgi:hypothetical protein
MIRGAPLNLYLQRHSFAPCGVIVKQSPWASGKFRGLSVGFAF